MTSHEPGESQCAASDDSEPQSELVDLVYALLGRRVRDLRVEFDGHGLVLRGRAESYHAKQLAQHVAMAALGLPLSANQIVVAGIESESPRVGGEDAPPEPVPHTAEPVRHTGRADPTTDPDDTIPGDNLAAERFP